MIPLHLQLLLKWHERTLSSPKEIIKSLHSSHVARVKALHTSKGRKSAHRFIAEGPAAVNAAASSEKYPIESLYVTETGAELLPAALRNQAIFTSEKVMAAISTVETAQGVLAICSMGQGKDAGTNSEEFDKIFSTNLPVLYMCEVNDPGNLGTIIRTADALGSAGVLLSQGSADPFSGKVVRSTAGSLWNVTLFRDVAIDAAIKKARIHQKEIIATDGTGRTPLREISGQSALWIFGNEARGLTKEISAQADKVVSIPMRGRAESLNLATAVAICLFHANGG